MNYIPKDLSYRILMDGADGLLHFKKDIVGIKVEPKYSYIPSNIGTFETPNV